MMDDKIIIMNDDSKCLVSQFIHLLFTGVHLKNIELFCLNSDQENYQTAFEALKEMSQHLIDRFYDGRGA